MNSRLLVAAIAAATSLAFAATAGATPPQLVSSVDPSFPIAVDGDFIYSTDGSSVTQTTISSKQQRVVFRAPRKQVIDDIKASGGTLGVSHLKVSKKLLKATVVAVDIASGRRTTIATGSQPPKLKKRRCASTATLAEVHKGTALAIKFDFCNSARLARTKVIAASAAGRTTVFAGSQSSFALARIGGTAFTASLRGNRLFLGGFGAGIWDTSSLQFTTLEPASRRSFYDVVASDSGDVLVQSSRGGVNIFGAESGYTAKQQVSAAKNAYVTFCGDRLLSATITRQGDLLNPALVVNPFRSTLAVNPSAVRIDGRTIVDAVCDATTVATLTRRSRAFELYSQPVAG